MGPPRPILGCPAWQMTGLHGIRKIAYLSLWKLLIGGERLAPRPDRRARRRAVPSATRRRIRPGKSLGTGAVPFLPSNVFMIAKRVSRNPCLGGYGIAGI